MGRRVLDRRFVMRWLQIEDLYGMNKEVIVLTKCVVQIFDLAHTLHSFQGLQVECGLSTNRRFSPRPRKGLRMRGRHVGALGSRKKCNVFHPHTSAALGGSPHALQIEDLA